MLIELYDVLLTIDCVKKHDTESYNIYWLHVKHAIEIDKLKAC